MDSEKILAKAMDRYGIIRPLLCGDDERSLKARIQELADSLWPMLDGRIIQFSRGAIEDWYYAYRQHGLDGLKDKGRQDQGTFRGLSEADCDFLDNIISEHPTLKTSVIIEKMKADGLIIEGKPSNSTIYRYLRVRRPEKSKIMKERRSFEAPYSGNLWQVDYPDFIIIPIF